MKCPNCGKKIPDDSQVCPGCKKKFKPETVRVGTLTGPKLGRFLYVALFLCAILITVFIYLKWQSTSIGESYTLAKMTEMYSVESDAANWFTNGTYIVLCLQLLAVIMWIVTFAKPSPVMPILAGSASFIGSFVFLIIALFGIGTAFAAIPNFTRTATVIPYLTLLLSAGEIACAWVAPKLLVPAFAQTPKSAASQTRTGGGESTKKLIDELDSTVKREDGAKRGK